MISATKLVQIVAPAHSTGFGTFSGSLDSAKVFAWSPTRLVTGASRAELQASSSWRHYHLTAETAGPRLHRELVLRLLREISPQESFFGLLARHDAVATSSPRAECAGRDEVPSCGPDPAIADRLRVTVLVTKSYNNVFIFTRLVTRVIISRPRACKNPIKTRLCYLPP